jgi:aspartate racemase
MGPRSTGPFLELVLDECTRQYGAEHDIDFPKMMICSLPAPFYPDRPVDHTAMEATLRVGLADLERAGVDFIAIACNSAHVYHAALARAVSVPLLDMVALTVNALPVDAHTVGLIAARPTMESGIYQHGIMKRGLRVTELAPQDEVDALIAAARLKTTRAPFDERWRVLMERALAASVDTVVLACADLSAMRPVATSSLTIVDATQALASEIVRRYAVTFRT